MKNKLKLIPTLFVIPLLMANSPAIKLYDKLYIDYKVVYSNEQIVNDKYQYNVSVKNIGNGYFNSLDAYDTFCGIERGSIDFHNELIGPNNSLNFVGTYDRKMDDAEPRISLQGFSSISENDLELSYFSEVKKSGAEYPGASAFYLECTSQIDVIDNKHDSYLICTYSYDGKESSFARLISGLLSEERYDFILNGEYEAEDVKLVKAQIATIETHAYEPFMGKTVLLIGVLMVVGYGVSFLILAGLIVATIFIIKGVKRSRRRKAEKEKIEQEEQKPAENKIE